MNKSTLYLLLLCLSLVACRKKDKSFPVIQPPVLNIDTVKLEGINTLRIYGKIDKKNINDGEYGIVYSQVSSPDIGNGTVVSFGKLKEDGEVTPKLDSLTGSTTFYIRLYYKQGSQIWYSNQQTAPTQALAVTKLWAQKAIRNDIVQAQTNINYPTMNSQDIVMEVYVGNIKAEVTENWDSEVRFKIPENLAAGKQSVVVKYMGLTALSPDSLYILKGKWVERKYLPAAGRSDIAYFQIRNKCYVVGGTTAFQVAGYTNQVWEYDINTDTWTRKNDFPTQHIYSGLGFTVNYKGYVLSGTSKFSSNESTKVNPNDYVWEYDPQADTWKKMAHLPDMVYGRAHGTGFTLNNKIYFGQGRDFNSYSDYNDWVMYNPATNSFVHKGRLPKIEGDWINPELQIYASKQNLTSFTWKGYGYLFGGDMYSFSYDDFLKYNPGANSWEKIPITSGPGDRSGTKAIAVGDHAYFYGGTKYTQGALGYYYRQINECWRYDLIRNTWEEYAYCPVPELLSYGAIFSTDRGFILFGGRNGEDFDYTNKMVEFIEE